MVFLCEFEVFRDRQGLYHAVPFGLKGEITGSNYRETCEKAIEWLTNELSDRTNRGEEPPQTSLGNIAKGDGVILLAGVTIVSEVERMRQKGALVSASKAAEMLGVSRGRVSQLIKSGQLKGRHMGRDTFVTIASVEERLKHPRKPGRPRVRPLETDTE